MAFGTTDLRKGWFADHAPGRGKVLTAGTPPPVGVGTYYFEVEVTAAGGAGAVCIGIANATFTLHRPQALDVSAGAYATLNGGGFVQVRGAAGGSSGWSGLPGSAPSSIGGLASLGDKIGVAFDTGGQLAWWRKATSDPTVWYGTSGAGTPDPSTGVQGFPMSGGAITSPYFVLVGFQYENFGTPVQPIAKVNFGATAFAAALPTGFVAWDLSGLSTLNPLDKSSDITLSGGNLIGTTPSFVAGANGPASFVRSTTSRA